ncbi:MAG: hypothetical protein IKQ59_14820 [Prevotella sp.]|nr:hypothetical protein [Prevotella sp.]
MRKTLLLFLLLITTIAWGSPNDSEKIVRLQQEVGFLKSKVSHLRQEDSRLRNLYQTQSLELDSIKNIQRQQAEDMSELANKMGADLTKANKKIDDNVDTLSDSINSRTWFSVFGIFLAFCLLGVVYVLLKKKINSGYSSIDRIRAAQESLETAQKAILEESVKLDNKLVELLDKQVATQPEGSGNDQPDHSLALKVADEIVRIETNLSRMDESVKGYKQLKKAVERIRTNFLANGYEIVEMLGKPYNEGMKVVANFVSDDTLAEGEQKITGIIKPQINYKGKMIQSAQITVSQNL